MNLLKKLMAILLPWCATVLVAETLDGSLVQVIGTTDKNPITYAVGEEMTFTIRVDFGGQSPEGKYTLKWICSGDDGQTNQGEYTVSDQPLVIKTSIKTPGFVRIKATLYTPEGKPLKRLNRNKSLENVTFNGGAGAELAKLSGTPEPEDFDKFWNDQKKKLDAVPIKFKMNRTSAPDAKVEVYAVEVACAGPRPVTGYLTIPANAAKKSLPGQVRFDGYGVHGKRDTPDYAPKSGPEDRIEFHINAHGYELLREAKYYQDFNESIKSNGKSYAKDPIQNENRETCYLYGMVLRVMRALQFVKQLEQWDGKNLIATGGSQGAAQSIWAAGLDPDVTLANVSVPGFCDIGGTVNFHRIPPDNGGIPYTNAINYYDLINFAKRVKCRVNVTRAGLGDYTCPPSRVTVFYNSLKCPKKITWMQGSTHGYVPPKPETFSIEN